MPTDLYKQFRNPTSGGKAVASAIRYGYKPLFLANEYADRLGDKDLKSLIVQVTGLGADDRIVVLIFSTFSALKEYADFSEDSDSDFNEKDIAPEAASVLPSAFRLPENRQTLGLNLSYTINLNLPATSDQAVFNAIFRSLKEHLLSSDE